MTLHRGGMVEGRVVTERGFPMRGAQVEVRSLQDPLPRRVFTLGDGTFRVPSVRGHVVLVASSAHASRPAPRSRSATTRPSP